MPVAIDTTNLPHPLAYSLGVLYGDPLTRIASDPQELRRMLMESGLPYGTEHDLSTGIELLINSAMQLIPKSRKGVAWLNPEKEAADTFGLFWKHGRQIYDFDVSQTAAFQQSVPDAAMVQDIMPSGSAVYLRFRSIEPIKVWEGRELDGAYVYRSRDGSFIGAMFFGRRKSGWPDFDDIGIPIEINLYPGERSLGAALTSAIKQKELAFASMARQIMETYGKKESDFDLPQWDFYRSAPETIHQLANLLGNTLIFLGSDQGAKAFARWPTDAPVDLVEKATRGSARERSAAVRDLWFKGHAMTFAYPGLKL